MGSNHTRVIFVLTELGKVPSIQCEHISVYLWVKQKLIFFIPDANGRLSNARRQQTYRVNFHCLRSSEHAHNSENNGFTGKSAALYRPRKSPIQHLTEIMLPAKMPCHYNIMPGALFLGETIQ